MAVPVLPFRVRSSVSGWINVPFGNYLGGLEFSETHISVFSDGPILDMQVSMKDFYFFVKVLDNFRHLHRPEQEISFAEYFA